MRVFTQFQATAGALITAGDIVVAVITADKALDNPESNLRLADATIALADEQMKTASAVSPSPALRPIAQTS
jgi:hypothetical protein